MTHSVLSEVVAYVHIGLIEDILGSRQMWNPLQTAKGPEDEGGCSLGHVAFDTSFFFFFDWAQENKVGGSYWIFSSKDHWIFSSF